jgi:regulation of enolase protein 1 (concanavalin A-like superfamily)
VFDDMQWLNEPPHWSVDDDTLVVTTDDKTDFWRETFYDFVRDDGHFLGKEVTGDFTAQVTLAGEYETLYDQMGLMLRVDQNNWVKTGIEFTDGHAHLSCVITRDFSDWSVVAAPEIGDEVTLRMTRHGTAVRVQFRTTGGDWQLLRLGYLPLPATCQVGVMACSPQRAGFTGRFSGFTVTEPISPDLHA